VFVPGELLKQNTCSGELMKSPSIKIIVEKHADGYVAYPLGMKGVVVADAVREIRSAIEFSHRDIWG
jgi:hypothetical protein